MPKTSSLEPEKQTAASSRLRCRLAERLFPSADEQASFIAALEADYRWPQAILWTGEHPDPSPFALAPRLEWQPAFVERLEPGQKPGSSDLHEQGAIYCLDFSSVFQAAVLLEVSEKSGIVVDVCSSPGGKAIFASVHLQPALLVCNEVIGKRLGPLIDNLRRCAISNALVTSADPALLAKQLPEAADVVIVDSPCSGQSLTARGKKAAGCFHPVTVNNNSRRQRRIIANASSLTAPGGFLAYMTCTYSREENEQIIEWFLDRFPEFEACEVKALAPYRSHLCRHAAYRIWPHQGEGAGGFTALLRRKSAAKRSPLNAAALKAVWRSPGTTNRNYTK